jgi:hypothetical protein
MEEEQIEDHGVATISDGTGMVRSFEDMFDAYLIGVLRQLVGLDLLREQEIYYLPKKGEVLPPLPEHSRKVAKGSISRAADADSSSALGSPIATHSPRTTTSSKVSGTRRGSSVVRRVKDSETNSVATSSQRGDSDDESPKAKKMRYSPAGETVPETQSQSTVAQRPRTRRKRLASDAAEWKPGEADKEVESDDQVSPAKRKGKGKGLKRARTTEDGGEGVRQHKRLRSHTSMPVPASASSS